MLIRFVKMTFREEFVKDFLEELNKRKEQIRNFEGCNYLQVMQDIKDPCIIFSHSFWESEAALNKYRNSDFFKETWKLTKPGFAAKAEAWSVASLHELN